MRIFSNLTQCLIFSALFPVSKKNKNRTGGENNLYPTNKKKKKDKANFVFHIKKKKRTTKFLDSIF